MPHIALENIQGYYISADLNAQLTNAQREKLAEFLRGELSAVGSAIEFIQRKVADHTVCMVRLASGTRIVYILEPCAGAVTCHDAIILDLIENHEYDKSTSLDEAYQEAVVLKALATMSTMIYVSCRPALATPAIAAVRAPRPVTTHAAPPQALLALDPRQRGVAETVPPFLIKGPAGTGKTAVGLSVIPTLVLKHHQPVFYVTEEQYLCLRVQIALGDFLVKKYSQSAAAFIQTSVKYHTFDSLVRPFIIASQWTYGPFPDEALKQWIQKWLQKHRGEVPVPEDLDAFIVLFKEECRLLIVSAVDQQTVVSDNDSLFDKKVREALVYPLHRDLLKQLKVIKHFDPSVSCELPEEAVVMIVLKAAGVFFDELGLSASQVFVLLRYFSLNPGECVIAGDPNQVIDARPKIAAYAQVMHSFGFSLTKATLTRQYRLPGVIHHFVVDIETLFHQYSDYQHMPLEACVEETAGDPVYGGQVCCLRDNSDGTYSSGNTLDCFSNKPTLAIRHIGEILSWADAIIITTNEKQTEAKMRAIFGEAAVSFKYLTPEKARGTEARFVIVDNAFEGDIFYKINDYMRRGRTLHKSERMSLYKERNRFHIAITRATECLILLCTPHYKNRLLIDKFCPLIQSPASHDTAQSSSPPCAATVRMDPIAVLDGALYRGNIDHAYTIAVSNLQWTMHEFEVYYKAFYQARGITDHPAFITTEKPQPAPVQKPKKSAISILNRINPDGLLKDFLTVIKEMDVADFIETGLNILLQDLLKAKVLTYHLLTMNDPISKWLRDCAALIIEKNILIGPDLRPTPFLETIFKNNTGQLFIQSLLTVSPDFFHQFKQLQRLNRASTFNAWNGWANVVISKKNYDALYRISPLSGITLLLAMMTNDPAVAKYQPDMVKLLTHENNEAIFLRWAAVENKELAVASLLGLGNPLHVIMQDPKSPRHAFTLQVLAAYDMSLARAFIDYFTQNPSILAQTNKDTGKLEPSPLCQRLSTFVPGQYFLCKLMEIDTAFKDTICTLFRWAEESPPYWDGWIGLSQGTKRKVLPKLWETYPHCMILTEICCQFHPYSGANVNTILDITKLPEDLRKALNVEKNRILSNLSVLLGDEASHYEPFVSLCKTRSGRVKLNKLFVKNHDDPNRILPYEDAIKERLAYLSPVDARPQPLFNIIAAGGESGHDLLRTLCLHLPGCISPKQFSTPIPVMQMDGFVPSFGRLLAKCDASWEDMAAFGIFCNHYKGKPALKKSIVDIINQRPSNSESLNQYNSCLYKMSFVNRDCRILFDLLHDNDAAVAAITSAMLYTRGMLSPALTKTHSITALEYLLSNEEGIATVDYLFQCRPDLLDPLIEDTPLLLMVLIQYNKMSAPYLVRDYIAKRMTPEQKADYIQKIDESHRQAVTKILYETNLDYHLSFAQRQHIHRILRAIDEKSSFGSDAERIVSEGAVYGAPTTTKKQEAAIQALLSPMHDKKPILLHILQSPSYTRTFLHKMSNSSEFSEKQAYKILAQALQTAITKQCSGSNALIDLFRKDLLASVTLGKLADADKKLLPRVLKGNSLNPTDYINHYFVLSEPASTIDPLHCHAIFNKLEIAGQLNTVLLAPNEPYNTTLFLLSICENPAIAEPLLLWLAEDTGARWDTLREGIQDTCKNSPAFAPIIWKGFTKSPVGIRCIVELIKGSDVLSTSLISFLLSPDNTAFIEQKHQADLPFVSIDPHAPRPRHIPLEIMRLLLEQCPASFKDKKIVKGTDRTIVEEAWRFFHALVRHGVNKPTADFLTVLFNNLIFDVPEVQRDRFFRPSLNFSIKRTLFRKFAIDPLLRATILVEPSLFFWLCTNQQTVSTCLKRLMQDYPDCVANLHGELGLPAHLPDNSMYHHTTAFNHLAQHPDGIGCIAYLYKLGIKVLETVNLTDLLIERKEDPSYTAPIICLLRDEFMGHEILRVIIKARPTSLQPSLSAICADLKGMLAEDERNLHAIFSSLIATSDAPEALPAVMKI